MMPADLMEDDWYSMISLKVASAVNGELPSRENAMLPAATSMGGRQDIEPFDVAAALRGLTLLTINKGRNHTVQLTGLEKT